MNGTSINIIDIFIWIGIPKPHLRRFRLAAGASFCFCAFHGHTIFEMTFLGNACQHLLFLHIFENTEYTQNVIPCRKVVEIRSELSSRPDW